MTDDKPKISVIIPIYNVEKYLRRCLDSMLSQTFTDWQAICVNDGSPDNCGEILSEYAGRDGRFKIVNKENGGLSDARNAGMRVADGDFILFLDSDDFIHPQTLEIAHKYIVQNNADVFLFGYDEKSHRKLLRLMRGGVDVSGCVPGAVSRKYNIDGVRVHKIKNLLFHCTERNRTVRVLHPVRRHCFPVLALYRRDFISDLPFVRGIIYEDFVWWSLLILRRPKTVMTKLPLYFYMPNPTSILNASRALRVVKSLCDGIGIVYDAYSVNATGRELKHYMREFLWPFTFIAMQHARQITDEKDRAIVADNLKKLYSAGVFDNPPNRRARRYLGRIRDFINT